MPFFKPLQPGRRASASWLNRLAWYVLGMGSSDGFVDIKYGHRKIDITAGPGVPPPAFQFKLLTRTNAGVAEWSCRNPDWNNPAPTIAGYVICRLGSVAAAPIKEWTALDDPFASVSPCIKILVDLSTGCWGASCTIMDGGALAGQYSVEGDNLYYYYRIGSITGQGDGTALVDTQLAGPGAVYDPSTAADITMQYTAAGVFVSALAGSQVVDVGAGVQKVGGLAFINGRICQRWEPYP